MNLKALAEWKKPDAKAPMSHDFIYLKGPEKANVWIQKVDEGLPGARDKGWGGQGMTTRGDKGDLLKEVENVLKLSSEGCTAS